MTAHNHESNNHEVKRYEKNPAVLRPHPPAFIPGVIVQEDQQKPPWMLSYTGLEETTCEEEYQEEASEIEDQNACMQEEQEESYYVEDADENEDDAIAVSDYISPPVFSEGVPVDHMCHLEEMYCDGTYESEGDENDPHEELFLIVQQLLVMRKPELDFLLACLRTAQLGDAHLLVHLAQGCMLFDVIEKRVYLWKEHGWQKDRGGDSIHLIPQLLIPCYEGVLTVLEVQIEQEKEGIAVKEQIEALKHTRRLVDSRIRSLGMISWIRGVIALAETHTRLRIMSEQWDLNPWLLPCPNGVIDLRSGLLSDGRPEDHLRTACPTTWQGLDVPAPRFERFLQEVFEDRPVSKRKELTAFLQRLMGYALSAQVCEHIIIVLYGEQGRNGKDTLMHVVSHVLGDLASMVSKDVLLDANKGHTAGGATPHLRDLQGIRVAVASEPERGDKFHVSQVKEMTGGGEIVTRGLFEKEMTRFMPTHTLFLLTNHKLRADAHDLAFWDRLILITFNMRFVDYPGKPNERKKDTQLWSELEQEAPGILAWLVRGCLEWQRIGLAIPAFVKADGESYREEEDNIQLFLNERCLMKDDVQIKARVLYQAYSDWCRDGNLHPFSHTRFGSLLVTKGIMKVHTVEGNYYQGLGLLLDD